MKNFIYAIMLICLIWKPVRASDFDIKQYDLVLQKYVSDGLVNYSALKKDQRNLQIYLKKVESLNPDEFKLWPENSRKAFWINVYNAVTIEGILRNYPIHYGGFIARRRFAQSSIRQIKGFWDRIFINIMGQKISLNQIEHEILRKKFNDPRIHFVLVCASLGCPALESRAFTSDNLDKRLDAAVKNFVMDLKKNRLDKEANVLYLSSIFKWYREDFKLPDAPEQYMYAYKEKDRGVLRFIIKYFIEKDKTFVRNNRPKIQYLSYDWALNEHK